MLLVSVFFTGDMKTHRGSCVPTARPVSPMFEHNPMNRKTKPPKRSAHKRKKVSASSLSSPQRGRSFFAVLTTMGIWASIVVMESAAQGRIPSKQVRSISVMKGRIRVRRAPYLKASTVGEIVASGRFAVQAVKPPAGGCKSRWFKIGPKQWVCSGWVQAHAEPPTRLDDQVALFRQGPWLLNKERRTPFYPSLRRLAKGATRWLRVLAGFQVRSYRFIGRRSFVHTATGGWVAASDTRPAPGTKLVGVDLAQGGRELPFAFALTDKAKLWKKKGPDLAPSDQTLDRYAAVRIRQKVMVAGQCYLELLSGKLLACRDAALADQPPPPPVGIGPQDQWLDLDGKQKILYARKGASVVRVMLVSTGRATPSGLFGVKEKWLFLTLYHRYGKHAYYLENVPFVIFFWKGFAFHEAYWHDGFGVTESHGCINLSPTDARWVFRFVRPDMPRGFVRIKGQEPGAVSIVRIRGTGRRVKTPWRRYLERRAARQAPVRTTLAMESGRRP